MNRFARRAFERDFARCVELDRQRKVENAAARARMLANPELVAELQREASRRGRAAIDWAEYFRNAGVA